MRKIQPEELHDFYSLIGEAIYSLHYLESSLHKILSIHIDFKDKAVSKAAAEKVLERYRKKTLGDLIKLSENHSLFDKKIINKLQHINSERRWLVHRMYEDTEYRLSNDYTARLKINSRITELTEAIFVLHRELTDWQMNTMSSQDLNS